MVGNTSKAVVVWHLSVMAFLFLLISITGKLQVDLQKVCWKVFQSGVTPMEVFIHSHGFKPSETLNTQVYCYNISAIWSSLCGDNSTAVGWYKTLVQKGKICIHLWVTWCLYPVISSSHKNSIFVLFFLTHISKIQACVTESKPIQ